MLRALPLIVLIVSVAACGPRGATEAPSGSPGPVAATPADSLALRVYEAMGGAAAWAALPALRFDFGTERDGQRQVRAKHLWNRRTGDYRVEWQRGADSTFVVLFNVGSRQGRAYLNGAPADSAAQAALLEQAYRRYINDTYWLLMPVKLFDEGVNRSLVPDSATADADVLHLTFGEVGLTPGDRYWVYVDRATGRVTRWAFVLEGDPEAAPRAYAWTGYEQLDTEAGPIVVATRKEALGQPTALLTDAVEAPTEPPADLFTDPNPRLFE